ncbi:hypothetical protein JCM17844_14180 [Iodidimonas gelatinilytica]|uniref:Accessory factor UbiK family protein n=1 Tax=Iodidimonas gelatinilytica TaxID=1236966 RepID=A0A5A7MPC3_9PROT|nr:accessory factor UbiK family protein [Iodidimonas gelatinilytica]GEQ97781.1 hypothetical protein JCM17844_14180 [Iodidimonas gelatinilytica]GER01269.1 hypothetical protein JCM17845_18920 [Iodidimonas gelatinilytica]
MQTDNRFLDDLAKLATGAAGALTSVRSEAEGAARAWLDRRLGELDLVTRDEFDAVKAMAAKAREENERLKARLEALEAGQKPAPKAPAKAAKKASPDASAKAKKAAPDKS